MKSVKWSIMITLWALMDKTGKHYTTPSWGHIGILLEKYHNVKVKRRWIFQCLKDMTDAGLIARKKRYRKSEVDNIEQLPGLISFTLAGLQSLVKMKVAGAYKAVKNMMAWVQKGKKTFPEPREIAPSMSSEDMAANLSKMRGLLATIG